MQVFCAVIRRLYEGKLERNGTYRYVLYDVFGFGPDAYRKAQEAGFLAISNAIVPDDYDKELLEYFCGKYLGTDQNVLLEAYARYVLDDLEGLLKDITDG